MIRLANRRRLSLVPGLEVRAVPEVFIGIGFEKFSCGCGQMFFGLEVKSPHEDLEAQEDKVGVEYVAAAVFADFVESSLAV